MEGWKSGFQRRTLAPANGSVGWTIPLSAVLRPPLSIGRRTLLKAFPNSAGVNGGFIVRRKLVPVPSRYDEMVKAPRTTVLLPKAPGDQAKPRRGWKSTAP